jgi:hypothetical protein
VAPTVSPRCMWRLILPAALVESVGLITSERDDARGDRRDCHQCTSGRRDDTGTSINNGSELRWRPIFGEFLRWISWNFPMFLGESKPEQRLVPPVG